MTGQLAQIINLIVSYNAGNFDSDFIGDNSTFQYCNSLHFKILKKKFFGGYKEVEAASTPREWFKYLSKKGCSKLRLVFQSDNKLDADHKLAGFVGGGGNWFIEAVYLGYSDYWQARWEVKKEKKDTDNRIWNVTYGLVSTILEPYPHPKIEVIDQKKKINEILIRISEFASSNDSTKDWEKTFNSAREMLDVDNPELSYHKDMVPSGALTKDRLQLLIAASSSFVFGGMGSWNDIGWFDDDITTKKYDELSAQLYKIMNESFVVAVNN